MAAGLAGPRVRKQAEACAREKKVKEKKQASWARLAGPRGEEKVKEKRRGSWASVRKLTQVGFQFVFFSNSFQNPNQFKFKHPNNFKPLNQTIKT